MADTREYTIDINFNEQQQSTTENVPPSPTGSPTSPTTGALVNAAIPPMVKKFGMQVVGEVSSRVGMVTGNTLLQEKINAYSNTALFAATAIGSLVTGNILGLVASLGGAAISFGAQAFDYNYKQAEEGVALNVIRQRAGVSNNRYR